MTDRVMRIWIGLFVVVALVLLGAMVVLFGSTPTIFKRGHTFFVRFQDAPGVASGTPVRRSGVHIGEVKSIELDDEQDNVRVAVSIELKYTLRHSEEPVLSIGLLGSDAVIDFVPKPKPEPGEPPLDRSAIEPGSEMVGRRQPTVNTVLNQASGVVPVAQDTLNDLRKSIQRIEKTLPLFDETLREFRDLARTAREATPTVKQTTEDIGELAKEVRKAVPGLSRTSDEIRELSKTVREAVPEFRRTGEDVAAAARLWGKLGERADVLLQANQDKLVKMLDNINEALTRVAAVFNDTNQTNIATMLKNGRAASEKFDGIARNADEITREGRTSVRRLNETLKDTDEVMKNLQGLTSQNNGRINTIVKNLDEGLDKLNRILSDVREVVRVAGQADGTVSRLLTDPSLYNRLDEAACMIPKMMPRLERILKDFETFADKLARHPESIGLGGVVRPDSGLKDPPARSPYPTYYPPAAPR